ncbi:MAG: GYD domain-containing protein [Roseiflexaceae bacterium]|mgnify:CR=1 FL=1|nr:GYD domain-containing protein [Roseiflexaceae bacterium]
MPKYLFEANYVGDGVQGLIREGGSVRRAVVAQAAQSLGGSLETFYYAFGDTDLYVIVDLPDNAAATALALTVNSGGVTTVKTIVLMTPEEVDVAVKRSPVYRAPGQ